MATWFRCYSDIADNYKLKMLSYDDRWHYIAILSCKSLGMLDGKRHDFVFRTVAMRLGLSVAELCEVARRLAEYNLLDKENLQPVGWNERQFISDNSTGRVRKHRINKETRNVSETLQKRNGNAPDTDTDTDTEKDITAKAVAGTKVRVPPCPVDKIIDLYHQVLPTLPKFRVRNTTRDGYIKGRWAQFYQEGDFTDSGGGLECFSWYFGEVAKSKFLMGNVQSNGRKPFVADLEWLMKPNNFAKVIEGKYHGA